MNSYDAIIIGTVLAGFGVAKAQYAGVSSQLLQSRDGTNDHQLFHERIDCIGAETKRQDVRLNKAYKDVMPSLPATRQKQLQEVQRIWIAYRDANCRFYADPDGGTMATVAANDCIMSATAARAAELEGFKQ